MATIENRNGKYRVKIRIKNISRSATFLKHSDAKAWAARTESDIMDRIQGNTPKNVTFGDVMERYMNEVTVQKRGVRMETYRIKFFMRTFISDILVADLHPRDFARWRDERLASVSSDTVNREMTIISAICNYGMKEMGVLRENPLKMVTKPKKAKARTRRPSDDEVRRLCMALGYDEDGIPDTIQKRIAVAIFFAIETAMRAGEICGIEWKHVDFKRRLIHIPTTKNGHPRDVPMSKRAIELLEKLKGVDDAMAFNMEAATLDTLFRRARGVCEIVDLHFHDTRREALTRMATKVDVMTLAKISGHRDLRILQNTYYAPDMSSVADLLG